MTRIDSLAVLWCQCCQRCDDVALPLDMSVMGVGRPYGTGRQILPWEIISDSFISVTSPNVLLHFADELYFLCSIGKFMLSCEWHGLYDEG